MHRLRSKDRTGRVVARGVVIAAALSALSIVAAACGGSPGASVANLNTPSTTTTTPHAGTGSSESNSGRGGPGSGGNATVGLGGITVQYSQCMRTHGVPNFPDPNAQGQVTMNGVNPTSASFQSAQSDCAKYQAGGGKPPTPAQTAQMQAQALRYSQCMRSHGITDFPDPQTLPGGGIGFHISVQKGQSSDLDPNGPMWQAAQKDCQSLLPGPRHQTSNGARP